MIHGVHYESFSLSNLFFVLDFVFETLSLDLAEKFWQVMETRASDLTYNVSRGKPPGTMIIRFLNSFSKRLDPYLENNLRSRVELFYLQAFGLEKAVNLRTTTPLEITSVEDGDYGVFLAVERALADMVLTSESEEALEAFFDNADKLHDIFASQKEMYRSDYSQLILDPGLFKLQLRDHSFQFKVGVQILLFIEALLQLRPEQVEAHGSQKATKHLVWSSHILTEEQLNKTNQSKRVWFARVKAESTPEQLESVRLTITHEKEAIAALTCTDPEPELGESVQLSDNRTSKPRPKHFHNMGNLQLTNLWKQPLGISAFVSAKDSTREPARNFYAKSKSFENPESREGARWISLFYQRNTDWNSFNAGDPPTLGPLFGDLASPRSPPHAETPQSRQETPLESTENRETPSTTPTDSPSRHSHNRNTSIDADEKDHKRTAPADVEPSPKRARVL